MTLTGQYLPGGGCFLTNTHTVYESDKETDDAECEDNNANVPEKTRLSEEKFPGTKVLQLTRRLGDQ